MRSRVVPMREMREKFGAEVKDFPYAFVLKSHYPGWDKISTDLDASQDLKTSKYIEIHSRP